MSRPRIKPRTILVTGAGGALGRRVMARLVERHQVIAVDFRRKVETDAHIPSYQVDLRKRRFEDIFREHPIDGVIHLGRILTNEYSRFRRYNDNVLGSRRLLDLAAKYKVGKVVVHSTHFVYGADAYNPAPIPETAPLKASELTMDLVDAVELENLAQIYLWRHPQLHVTVLRPCNIVGPGVRNSMSRLLSGRIAPALAGFSPIMQFLHVEDMADAVVAAFERRGKGVFNVAPDDWVAYQDFLRACGCRVLPLPSLPPFLPRRISELMGWQSFPPYLINFFKYPVVLDGRGFADTYRWQPQYSLAEISAYYRSKKRRGGDHRA
ncbi:SDR family oxidoreductase [Abyssibacter profundi]|uniref:NAD-dependent epimerase n=1 Tax=Abyssibacter profundi TaxID=2182787 RepID=A0A383XRC2_9GAMM|nr:SDR family oxidoreductase [Abyssibacter profundi]PWN55176.1 NAD-dependent epimerase [Abyssibacter profundi]